MKILVCVKQVPDMESKFKIDSSSKWYDQSDLVYKINEYDEYAAEEAVRLKEKVSGSELTVLSIGPERVKDVIRKVLAMGADKGIHILDNEEHLKDPFQKASAVAEYAKSENFDIIFTGLQSQDRGSAQLAPLLAGMLNYSFVSTVVAFENKDGYVEVARELEGGLRAKVKVKLPAVVACQLGLNTPRYPTLPNIMKAKRKELKTVNIDELLKAEPLVETGKVYFPERKAGGIVLEGKADEMADELIKILKEKTQVVK